MTQDCSDSHSTAGGTGSLQQSEGDSTLEGKHVLGPDHAAGPEVKLCPSAKPHDTAWCYLFVHHRKVKAFEERLLEDGVTHFIHRTVKYVPRHKDRDSGGVRKVESPSVSGLVFLQGSPKKLQAYLNANMQSYMLCKDCSTGKPATIPCGQMEPFMRLSETDPERLRFLLHPFLYYSKNRTLLRITTGDYAGLEGYVIRIARDRRLVMDVGGMAVAISGIHAERFEEVNKEESDRHGRDTFYKRTLHERNAFIDRYFHPVKSSQEAQAQAEDIDILLNQTLADVRNGKLDTKDAYDTFRFMIEEIGYYYAPFADRLGGTLLPVFQSGKKVMEEIANIVSELDVDSDLRRHCETQYEELGLKYGHLFVS